MDRLTRPAPLQSGHGAGTDCTPAARRAGLRPGQPGLPRWLHLLALIAALAAGVFAFPLLSRAAPAAGTAAPDFALKDLHGANQRLSEFRGDIVVLTFWASWCGPCRETLTELRAVDVEQTDRPVVISVNIEGDADRATLRGALAQPRLHDPDRRPAVGGTTLRGLAPATDAAARSRRRRAWFLGARARCKGRAHRRHQGACNGNDSSIHRCGTSQRKHHRRAADSRDLGRYRVCASGADAAAFKSVDQDVQSLKKQLVDLNKDLFKLEEELLYPASTQVAVFLSVDVGTFFALDSVTLKLDDKEVTNYLYTEREVQALHRGGVQRLYLGNLKAGEHELVAFFTGKGPHERDYRRGATLMFEKGVGANYSSSRSATAWRRCSPSSSSRSGSSGPGPAQRIDGTDAAACGQPATAATALAAFCAARSCRVRLRSQGRAAARSARPALRRRAVPLFPGRLFRRCRAARGRAGFWPSAASCRGGRAACGRSVPVARAARRSRAHLRPVLAGTVAPAIAGRAFFYLARIGYQRGHLRAGRAQSRADPWLPFRANSSASAGCSRPTC